MAKLDHVTVVVSDWQASRDWYVRNFGFMIEFEVPKGGHAGLGVAALQDEAGLTLFVEQSAHTVSRCGCIHTLQVDDVEKVYRELSARGVAFMAAPSKRYWGYGAELADPDGHVLYLWDEVSMREKGGN